MEHTVIIPEFMPDENIRNFIPEVVKIQMGDTVRWINIGKDSHYIFLGWTKILQRLKS